MVQLVKTGGGPHPPGVVLLICVTFSVSLQETPSVLLSSQTFCIHCCRLHLRKAGQVSKAGDKTAFCCFFLFLKPGGGRPLEEEV